MESQTSNYVKTQITRVQKGYSDYLDFYKQNLTYIPEELYSLKNLKRLILKSNKISYISPEIKQLQNLEILDLSNNNLKTLPSSINLLNNLSVLNLQNNSLQDVPIDIYNLLNLKTLNLSDNYLRELPSEISNLIKLENLYIQNNYFTDIPSSIYKIKSLKRFHFISDKDDAYKIINNKQNTAKYISNEICQLDDIETFKVGYKNMLIPPPEIVYRGPKDIKRYFLQIEAEGEDYLFEAKLIIVGEAGAGKTTISRKLISIDAPMPSDDETTRGIDILKYSFKTKTNQDFKVNIWDFGGQEIYHSTHQFFLTKRSLYLLICDTRKEDTAYTQWLQQIELLSDSSPVIIINNEKQNRSRDINISALKSRFQNLKSDILRANFADKRGINEILKIVTNEIQQLPHVGDKLPKTWIRVRKEIETQAKKHKYISEETYNQICTDNGISDFDKIEQLSNYLHDIGVFLHFKDGSILQRTIILDNSWATEAVYKILDDNKIKEELEGHVTISDIQNLWNAPEYRQRKQELLSLMIKFELCYKVENSQLYIIPQLLPINEPELDWDYTNNLNFRYVYEFMPRGIITRLIVRLHDYIKVQRLLWRTGVIIEKGDNKALIKESIDNREIKIFIRGRSPKTLLIIILEEIDKINQSFGRIKFEKYVPCNCDQCKNVETPEFFKYSDLLRRKDNGKLTIECGSSYEDIFVLPLLDGVTDKDKPSRVKIHKNSLYRSKEDIFISYSHADMKWLTELKLHLTSLRTSFNYFDDTNIEPGQEWKNIISSALNVSKIAILLVSKNFLSSNFIQNYELPKILDKAENEGTIILILILSPCLVEDYPELMKYQFINSPKQALSQMNDNDVDLTIMKLINKIKQNIIEKSE